MYVTLSAAAEMTALIMSLCLLLDKTLPSCAEVSLKDFSPKALISALGLKLSNALGLFTIAVSCTEMSNQ